jgi:hypothetical protein
MTVPAWKYDEWFHEAGLNAFEPAAACIGSGTGDPVEPDVVGKW